MATNLGYKVVTRDISWDDLVRRSWGSEFSAADKGIYEFSNGRRFDSTDRGTTGIYGVSGINYLMVGDEVYPDMTSNDYLLQLTLDKIELG